MIVLAFLAIIAVVLLNEHDAWHANKRRSVLTRKRKNGETPRD